MFYNIYNAKNIFAKNIKMQQRGKFKNSHKFRHDAKCELLCFQNNDLTIY